MPDPLTAINTRRTPQGEAADPRQVENSAGGFTFTIDKWAQFRRFLTLGTDGGTYYTSASELTAETAKIAIALATSDGEQVVRELVAYSTEGRAPRQNATLFTLAAVSAFGSPEARKSAHANLPAIARTGTHLFLFARYAEQLRGWGRGLRGGVAGWYEGLPTDRLAYQSAKYRQREGWSHRDLLRLSHPRTDEAGRKVVFDWICGRGDGTPFLAAVDRLTAVTTVDEAVTIIREHAVSWEMVPTALLNEASVWTALIEAGRVPLGALVRQLPRLTRIGVLPPMGGLTAAVIARLNDAGEIRRSRLHPINVLVALRTYASGHSARGEGEWSPVGRIVDALDAAFYLAFGNVEPTGKRTMLALDVSGSMASAVSGLPLTCREATAALALVTAATEPEHMIVGFTAGNGWRNGAVLTDLAITPRQRLDDVIGTVLRLPFGGTDCALPMIHALEKGLAIDTFIVYTDNETWHGSIHPHQALAEYRRKTGIDAKLVVVAMTATKFSIADPTDAGMLDVSGFDSAVPNLISGFSAGVV